MPIKISERTPHLAKMMVDISNDAETVKQRTIAEKYLEISGLKIGDIVIAHYPMQYGTAKQSWHGSVDAEAKIILGENSIPVAQSIEEIKYSMSKSNGRTGRNEKTWWEYGTKIKTVPLTNIVSIVE